MSKYEILRGVSSKPFYVTSEGLELEHSNLFVQTMEGSHRIPDILKQVDYLCRTISFQ